MGLLDRFVKRIILKQTVKNAHGLAKSLLKAFNTVQEFKSENSYHENVMLALKARPEWHQVDNNNFGFKGRNYNLRDDISLKEVVIMVSNAENAYGSRWIPVTELTTLQTMAQEEIDNYFKDNK